jgi:GNAT superfamily N-acetyltransferase
LTAIVRLVQPADLDAVARLCAEHAAYEKADVDLADAGSGLGAFLFSETPRAWCAVVELEHRLIGYATWSREFSTWHAAEYVHMDCLYVSAAHRNRGHGYRLLTFVAGAATAMGCRFVEWQTPHWNTDAMRFYDRYGAVRSQKVRYRLALAVSSTPTEIDSSSPVSSRAFHR